MAKAIGMSKSILLYENFGELEDVGKEIVLFLKKPSVVRTLNEKFFTKEP